VASDRDEKMARQSCGIEVVFQSATEFASAHPDKALVMSFPMIPFSTRAVRSFSVAGGKMVVYAGSLAKLDADRDLFALLKQGFALEYQSALPTFVAVPGGRPQRRAMETMLRKGQFTGGMRDPRDVIPLWRRKA
jgi:hypothetical protein